MEKLNDFLKNLADRFSNPLIFSFVCSWLVINWQITIGLLWYDAKLIENTGSDSLFTFVIDNINWNDSFKRPFYIALGYTFLMPPIKIIVQAFNTKITQIGEGWNLKIMKEGKIGIDKFLQLRDDHKKRTAILEKVISEESDYLDKYNEANTSKLETQDRLNHTLKQVNEKDIIIDSFTNIGILAGTWVNTYENTNKQGGEETIYINRNEYYVISQFGDRTLKFEIKDFHFDKSRNNVFFIKEFVPAEKKQRPNGDHFLINRLRFEGNDLIGTENNTTRIHYTRA